MQQPHGASSSVDSAPKLYGDLEAFNSSPIVRLNRAVAAGEADGPRAGLAVLDGLDEVLPSNHRLFAVRADLACRAGLTDLARTSYVEAIELCSNERERGSLVARANDFMPNGCVRETSHTPG